MGLSLKILKDGRRRRRGKLAESLMSTYIYGTILTPSSTQAAFSRVVSRQTTTSSYNVQDKVQLAIQLVSQSVSQTSSLVSGFSSFAKFDLCYLMFTPAGRQEVKELFLLLLFLFFFLRHSQLFSSLFSGCFSSTSSIAA